MIVSHEHKYLFLETPRTASTAIQMELRQYYGGRPVLHKHANFSAIPQGLKQRMKGYHVFAGVRNPLDDAASRYHKLRGNDEYLDRSKWTENGGWVDRRLRRLCAHIRHDATFKQYLRAAHRLPFCSRIVVNARHCDSIIRYESLQDDFERVLGTIGLKAKRPLPRRNATRNKRAYAEYLDNSEEERALIGRIFGPFMIEWGYLKPSDSLFGYVTWFNKLQYRLVKMMLIGYHVFAYQRRRMINARKPLPTT